MSDVTNDIEDLISSLTLNSKIGPSGTIYDVNSKDDQNQDQYLKQDISDSSSGSDDEINPLIDHLNIQDDIDDKTQYQRDEKENEIDIDTPLLTKKHDTTMSRFIYEKRKENLEQVLESNFQEDNPLEKVLNPNDINIHTSSHSSWSSTIISDKIHPSLQNLDTEGQNVPDEEQVPYADMAEKYREWFRLRLKFLHKSKSIGLENKVPDAQKDSLVFQTETISYSSLEDGPVIYVNGRTQYGESIFLRVFGFRPFLYMKIPSNWDRNIISEFMRQLSRRLYSRLWYSIRWSMEHVTDKEKDAHIRHRIKIISSLLDESSVGGAGIPPTPFKTFQKPQGNGCNMILSWLVEPGRGLQDYIEKRDIESTDNFLRIELSIPELVKECKLLIMNHKGGSEGLYTKEMMQQSRSKSRATTSKKKNIIQKNKLDSWVKHKSSSKNKKSQDISNSDSMDQLGMDNKSTTRKFIQPWLSKDLECLCPDRLYVYEANVDFTTRFMIALNKNDNEHSNVNKRRMGHNPETCLYIKKEDYQDNIIRSLFEHDENGVPLYPDIDAPDEIIDPYIDKILEMITPKDHSGMEDNIQSISSCDIEVIAKWDTLYIPDLSLRCYDRIYPRQVLSFDIEARPKDNGGFPTPEDDPVIDICNIMYNTETPGIYDAVDLIVGRCSKEGHTFQTDDKYKLNSVSIGCFRTEADMFRAYHALYHIVDPDMITGFNIERFDTVYLLKRAKELGVDIFKYLGRNLCQPSYSKKTLFESSARGAVESFFTYISGRQQLDVWKYTSNSQKFTEYNLDSIANKILKLNKIDVHYSQIPRLLKSPKGRRTLRVYCSFDALLSLLIMNFWEQYVSTISMARVVGTMFQNVLERGQQFRIFTMLVRYTKQCRTIEIGPDKQRYQMPTYYVPVMYEDEKPSESYTGASVANPVKGFYTDIIITQDFAGLYPSIMMAHNMCYCTCIPYRVAIAMGLELGKDFYSTPHFDISDDLERFEEIIDPEQPCFVYPHIQPGFMPMMLNDLKVERKAANTEKEKHQKGSRMYVNMDTKQLALKTVSNSGYGFTGVGKRGMLPKKEIASAVTDTGRLMINKVRYTVKKEFVNNRGLKLTVLYGDTDSVMIIMHGYSIEDAERIGVEMAAFMTKMFRPPICLDYEKLFLVAMFFKVKKKYIGIKKLLVSSDLFVHKAGIDANRRDGIPYMNRVTESIINNLLMKKDFNLMLSVLKQQINDFRMGKFSMLDIITTKKYSKTYESYTTLPLVPHLARKMYRRDHNSAPKPGDRVPFVIIKHPWKTVVERGEDPLYAYEHGLPIDIEYYIEKYLYEPIKRILDPIIRENSQGSKPNTITLQELDEIFFGTKGITVKQSIPENLGDTWSGFVNRGRCFICGNICTRINMNTKKSNILCDECLEPKQSMDDTQTDDINTEDEKQCFICDKFINTRMIREIQHTKVCILCIHNDPVQSVRKIIETNKKQVDDKVEQYENECIKCMKGDKELIEKCNSKQCVTFWMKRAEKVKQNECSKLYDRYVSQFNDNTVVMSTCSNHVLPLTNVQKTKSMITLSIVREPKNKKKSTSTTRTKKTVKKRSIQSSPYIINDQANDDKNIQTEYEPESKISKLQDIEDMDIIIDKIDGTSSLPLSDNITSIHRTKFNIHDYMKTLVKKPSQN